VLVICVPACEWAGMVDWTRLIVCRSSHTFRCSRWCLARLVGSGDIPGSLKSWLGVVSVSLCVSGFTIHRGSVHTVACVVASKHCIPATSPCLYAIAVGVAVHHCEAFPPACLIAQRF
jgi:hypothetical protein